MNSVHTTYNGRSLASVVAELKDELREFLDTRLNMLVSELKETTSKWKTALPMMVVGGLLLGIGFLLFTGFLVAVIAAAFGSNQYAVALGLIIVTIAYCLFGGMALLFGLRSLKETGLKPKRTLRVLKEDQLWLRNEARNQL